MVHSIYLRQNLETKRLCTCELRNVFVVLFHVGRRVIFAEMMYRQMTIIEAENMYTGDMTVHSGQWYTTRSKNRTSYHRFGMVYGLR